MSDLLNFKVFCNNHYDRTEYDFVVESELGNSKVKLNNYDDFTTLVGFYEKEEIIKIREVVPRETPIFARFTVKNRTTSGLFTEFNQQARNILICIYQQVIKAAFGDKYSDDDLRCFAWVSEHETHGLHTQSRFSIVFPFTMETTIVQKGQLRISVRDGIKNAQRGGLFPGGLFSIHPDISIDNFIDRTVYNGRQDEKDLWVWPKHEQHIMYYNFLPKEDIREKLDLEEPFEHPSGDYYNFFSFFNLPKRQLTSNIAALPNSVPLPKFIPKYSDRTSETVQLETQKASKLVELISKARDNMEIGQCLYNISEGSEDGRMIWKMWSNQDIEFDFKWQDFIYTGKGIATLYYWAKQDSPDEYHQLKENDAYDVLKEAVSWYGGDYDIARVVKILCGNTHKCASLEKKRIWYRFKNNRWHQDADANFMFHILNTKIPEMVKTLRSEVMSKLVALKDDEDGDHGEEIDNLEIMKKNLSKLPNNLKKTGYKKGIIYELAHLYYDEDFLDNLDENCSLLCFTNGIYDLDKLEFKPGTPEDNVSLCTGYEYKEFYWEHPKVLEVMEYFGKVFVDDDLRRTMLKFFGSTIHGGNLMKRLCVCTGVVNNAKTATQKLLTRAFGKYSLTAPSTFLTGRSNESSGVSPDVVRTKGIRHYNIPEPTEQERFNSNKVKLYSSGGDPVFARGLHSDGIEFTPQFVPIIFCNNLPKMRGTTDKAIESRFFIAWFGSTFDDKAPESVEEQYATRHFPVDTKFSNRIPGMVQACMWILIEYYKIYIEEGIPKDCQVMNDTKAYIRKQNPVMMFMDDKLKFEEGAMLQKNFVWTKYREWYSETYGNKNTDMFTFLKEMDHALGDHTKDGWKHYVYIQDN